MSAKEFTNRFVFSATPRSLRLALALFVLSGSSLVALAVSPDDVIKATNTVAGMDAMQLLAAITLASLALCGIMLWVGYKMAMKATVSLTQIADRLNTMKCIAKKGK
jgi:hypothetical protein